MQRLFKKNQRIQRQNMLLLYESQLIKQALSPALPEHSGSEPSVGGRARMGAMLVCAVFALALATTLVQAQVQTAAHVVRRGDTLASIARLYYAQPPRESVLVAANGLNAHGGAAIVAGLRLFLPVVSYHRSRDGDTWSSLAKRYYGQAKRAFVLIEANGGAAGQAPDRDSELIIPYPLRHVAAHGESLAHIAATYYEQANSDILRLLRRFNGLKRSKLRRGDLVLVPMQTLVLSAQGRKQLQSSAGQPDGQVRAVQAAAAKQLPKLKAQLRLGRYAQVLALGYRLLGRGQLTEGQKSQIYVATSVAYLALGEREAAMAQLRLALKAKPKLELSERDYSPTLRSLWMAAQEATQR